MNEPVSVVTNHVPYNKASISIESHVLKIASQSLLCLLSSEENKIEGMIYKWVILSAIAVFDLWLKQVNMSICLAEFHHKAI